MVSNEQKEFVSDVTAWKPDAIVSRLKSQIDENATGWKLSVLETIAEWPLARETIAGKGIDYLIAGEAFDWRLLARRLLDECSPNVEKEIWWDWLHDSTLFGGFAESYNDSSKNNVIRNIKDFNDYLLDIINGVQEPSEIFENSNKQALKHIIIDEFQDNNYLQFELAKMLAIKKAESHITVVGDINQCIYTFQGANPEIFNNFKEFYKDAEAEEITLKLNYRSTQKIVALANKLLKKGKYPYEPEPKESKTENESGEKIQIYEFSNIEDECNFFVDTIIDEIGKKFKRRNGKEENKTFGDFIILTRTNEIRKKINAMLVSKGIPNRTKTYHYLESAKSGKKYTTLLNNIIRVLSDGIGVQVEKFMKITTLEKFMKILVGECKTKCQGKHTEWTADNAISYKVLDNLAWCYMKKYGGDKTHPLTLKKFYNYITKFEDNRAIGEATWDDTAKKWTNVKPRNNIGDAVEIKTVHSVKGEEYPFVIISSSYQNHFPLEYKKRELRVPPEYLRYRRKHCMICNSKLTLGKEKISCPNKECKCHAGIEKELHEMEERRLYYVAMTRAMNELIITVPKNIEIDNVSHHTEVSEFLTDLDYQHDPENIDYHDMSEGAEVSQGEMDSLAIQHKQQWENDFQEKYNEVNEKLAKTKADAGLDYEKKKLEQIIKELLREKNELLDEKKRHDVFDKKETSWEILEVAHDEPLDKTKIAYERIRKFWADRMGQEATPERKRHAEEQFKRITTAFENIEKGIGDTKI